MPIVLSVRCWRARSSRSSSSQRAGVLPVASSKRRKRCASPCRRAGRGKRRYGWRQDAGADSQTADRAGSPGCGLPGAGPAAPDRRRDGERRRRATTLAASLPKSSRTRCRQRSIRRTAGGSHQQSIAHVKRRPPPPDLRKTGLQRRGVAPVGCRPAAIEQPGGGENEHPGTDRNNPTSAGVGGSAAHSAWDRASTPRSRGPRSYPPGEKFRTAVGHQADAAWRTAALHRRRRRRTGTSCRPFPGAAGRRSPRLRQTKVHRPS